MLETPTRPISCRVLFLGDSDESSTARHRADALRRIGASVVHLNPHHALDWQLRGLVGALHYRTGYLLLQSAVGRWLAQSLQTLPRFDACWVDGGEILGRAALARLHQHCGKVVLFNHDDPTGKRDGNRFLSLKRAVSSYDACAVVRVENIAEFTELGSSNVMHTWRTYDEVAHRPLEAGESLSDEFTSDVAFVGRRIPGEDRDKFMSELARGGLNLAIWGDNWQTSPLWPQLRAFWRGPSLSGRNYVKALSGARACLGMLSKANRDLHTTRSLEIPFAGGLFCAERTSEHSKMYVEGKEAVFWSTVDECAEKCLELVADDQINASIRAGGMARVRANRVGNEDVARRLLDRVGIR